MSVAEWNYSKKSSNDKIFDLAEQYNAENPSDALLIDRVTIACSSNNTEFNECREGILWSDDLDKLLLKLGYEIECVDKACVKITIRKINEPNTVKAVGYVSYVTRVIDQIEELMFIDFNQFDELVNRM